MPVAMDTNSRGWPIPNADPDDLVPQVQAMESAIAADVTSIGDSIGIVESEISTAIDALAVQIAGFVGIRTRIYHIAFSDYVFIDAETTVSKWALKLFPVFGERISAVNLTATEAFAGTGITSMTVSVGSDAPGNGAYYAPPWDIFQAIGSSYSIEGLARDDLDSNVVLIFTANANFGDGSVTVLTAGSLDVTITTEPIL